MNGAQVLACGDTGVGAMASVDNICEHVKGQCDGMQQTFGSGGGAAQASGLWGLLHRGSPTMSGLWGLMHCGSLKSCLPYDSSRPDRR